MTDKNVTNDALTKAFVQKRLSLVPIITVMIVIEMIYMFIYICLTVYCRKDFET